MCGVSGDGIAARMMVCGLRWKIECTRCVAVREQTRSSTLVPLRCAAMPMPMTVSMAGGNGEADSYLNTCEFVFGAEEERKCGGGGVV